MNKYGSLSQFQSYEDIATLNAQIQSMFNRPYTFDDSGVEMDQDAFKHPLNPITPAFEEDGNFTEQYKLQRRSQMAGALLALKHLDVDRLDEDHAWGTYRAMSRIFNSAGIEDTDGRLFFPDASSSGITNLKRLQQAFGGMSEMFLSEEARNVMKMTDDEKYEYFKKHETVTQKVKDDVHGKRGGSWWMTLVNALAAGQAAKTGDYSKAMEYNNNAANEMSRMDISKLSPEEQTKIKQTVIDEGMNRLMSEHRYLALQGAVDKLPDAAKYQIAIAYETGKFNEEALSDLPEDQQDQVIAAVAMLNGQKIDGDYFGGLIHTDVRKGNTVRRALWNAKEAIAGIIPGIYRMGKHIGSVTAGYALGFMKDKYEREAYFDVLEREERIRQALEGRLQEGDGIWESSLDIVSQQADFLLAGGVSRLGKFIRAKDLAALEKIGKLKKIKGKYLGVAKRSKDVDTFVRAEAHADALADKIAKLDKTVSKFRDGVGTLTEFTGKAAFVQGFWDEHIQSCLDQGVPFEYAVLTGALAVPINAKIEVMGGLEGRFFGKSAASFANAAEARLVRGFGWKAMHSMWKDSGFFKSLADQAIRFGTLGLKVTTEEFGEEIAQGVVTQAAADYAKAADKYKREHGSDLGELISKEAWTALFAFTDGKVDNLIETVFTMAEASPGLFFTAMPMAKGRAVIHDKYKRNQAMNAFKASGAKTWGEFLAGRFYDENKDTLKGYDSREDFVSQNQKRFDRDAQFSTTNIAGMTPNADEGLAAQIVTYVQAQRDIFDLMKGDINNADVKDHTLRARVGNVLQKAMDVITAPGKIKDDVTTLMETAGVNREIAEIAVSAARLQRETEAMGNERMRGNARSEFDYYSRGLGFEMNEQIAAARIAGYVPGSLKQVKQDDGGTYWTATVNGVDGKQTTLAVFQGARVVDNRMVKSQIGDDSAFGVSYDQRMKNEGSTKRWKDLSKKQRADVIKNSTWANNDGAGVIRVTNNKGETEEISYDAIVRLANGEGRVQAASVDELSHEYGHSLFRFADTAGMFTNEEKLRLASALGIDTTKSDWNVALDEAMQYDFEDYMRGVIIAPTPAAEKHLNEFSQRVRKAAVKLLGGDEKFQRYQSFKFEDAFELLANGKVEQAYKKLKEVGITVGESAPAGNEDSVSPHELPVDAEVRASFSDDEWDEEYMKGQEKYALHVMDVLADPEKSDEEKLNYFVNLYNEARAEELMWSARNAAEGAKPMTSSLWLRENIIERDGDGWKLRDFDFTEDPTDSWRSIKPTTDTSSSTRFSVNWIDRSEWNDILDRYERGEIKRRDRVIVSNNTPVILQRVGMPNLPITITGSILDKITGAVTTNDGRWHKIPVAELRNLQIELDNPIAVFDSATDPSAYVILTRMVDLQNRERAVVAVKTDIESRDIRINPIASIYGKTKSSIGNWIYDGNLRYVNKSARKTYSAWLQLPGDSVLRANRVLTEKDFSNELPGIIQYPLEKVNSQTAFSIELEELKKLEDNLKGRNPNSSSDVDIVAKLRSKVNPDIRFSILGEQGVSRLDNAADILDNLTVARQMLGDRKWGDLSLDEKKKIRYATGWEMGGDGKWRYETPDLFPAAEPRKFNGTLREYFESVLTSGPKEDYKSFFKAYPAAENIHLVVKMGRGWGWSGSYSESNNAIELSMGKNTSVKDMREAFAHEVQHFIQHEEGFAEGGNTGTYEQLNRKEAIENAVRRGGEDYREFIEKCIINLANNPNNIRFLKALSDKATTRDYFLFGASRLSSLGTAIGMNWNKIADYINEDGGRFSHAVDAVVAAFKETKANTRGSYRRLAGEVEAYNMMTRLGKDYEWRHENLLESTEDVARESQIYYRTFSDGMHKLDEGMRQYGGTTTRFSVADERTTRLAPNGKRSNLTDRQYDQVRTAEFKAWFGDWENDPANASKVVDANGEPLVVYHNSHEVWSKYDGGSIWTWRDNEGPGSSSWFGNVQYDLFVNIKKPFVWDAEGQAEEDLDFSEYNGDEHTTASEIVRWARDNGYDGVIIRNIKEFIDRSVGDDFVAFSPTQIKSATDNTGAFSPTNPDIRFSIANLYTGSAADYDKPSLHAVGTGEGNQVYGWGLYASNQRGVAEHYTDAGDDNTVYLDGKKLDSFKDSPDYPVVRTAFGFMDGAMSEDAAINWAKSAGQGDAFYDKVAKFIDDNRGKWNVVPNKAYVYEQTFFTNRPEGDESHLISWYEPMSVEHLTWLKDALENNSDGLGLNSAMKANALQYVNFLLNAKTHKTTNGEVYNRIASAFWNSPKVASELFVRADIDGVKYPVDSYGGKSIKDGNEAGWNYVSFRDDNIRIDRKWVDGEQRFSIATSADAAERMVAGTKIVDADGEPKMVYHHTENDFDDFDLSRSRKSMDIQGFFFYDDEEAGEEYGSKTVRAYLNLTNPYVVDSSEKMNAIPWDMSEEGAGVRARNWLLENGYDGVIRDKDFMGDSADEIIALNPEQVVIVREPSTRFSLILGEKGARKLEENGQIIDNLAVAKEMLGDRWWKDLSTDEKVKIKLATGWERGADGLWRYEVPDLKYPFGQANDYLSIQEDIAIRYNETNEDLEKLNRYWAQAKAKAIEKYGDDPWMSMDKIREFLSFAYQGVKERREKTFEEIKKLQRKLKKARYPKTKLTLRDFAAGTVIEKAYPELMDTKITIKSMRGNYAGMVKNDEIIIDSDQIPYDAIRTVTHEVQHLIQKAEGFARGGNERHDGKEGYHRLAGEVEARNAEKRIGKMKAGGVAKWLERLAESGGDPSTVSGWLLEQTEDVARDSQIVLHDFIFSARDYLKTVDAVKRGTTRFSVADERTTRLAPNGKRSNLTDRQYDQVRTAEFKAWFGDWENDPANASKVVDENGEPLVVYRGEDSEQTEFFFGYREDNGWLQRNWFTSSKEVAEMFGNTNGRGYFLNIRNVAEYDAKGNRYDNLSYNGETVSNSVVDQLYGDNPSADGVVLRNIVETDKGNIVADDWLVKDTLPDAPNRIKSATDNTGAFSSTNSDIRFSIADGAGVDAVESDGTVRFSLATYDSDGRETLSNWLNQSVANGSLTRKDADDILKSTDAVRDVMKKWAKSKKYISFSKWSEAKVELDENGKPYFGVIRTNGDYAYNIDFSTVCKKRRPLDAIFNALVSRGIVNADNIGTLLSRTNIPKMQEIIKRHGLEVACALCFVDAKRYKISEYTNDFAKLWNGLVDEKLNRPQDWEKRLAKVKGKNGDEPRFVRRIEEDPSARVTVSPAELVSGEAFDTFLKTKSAVAEMYRGYQGVAKPKESTLDAVYNNDIIKLFKHPLNPNVPSKLKPDAAFAVGGVRLQSFSDFVARLTFDYVQMFADLAARKLPLHSYTKEPDFIKLFGKTGAKLNMSLVPNGTGVLWLTEKEMKAQSRLAIHGEDNQPVVKDGKIACFDFADECFPPEEAFALRSEDGNVGTIMVGVSDEHIDLMLSDPRIDMVIPYHKSSINPEVATARGIDKFKDYTSVQNTINTETGKATKTHFDFYGDLGYLDKKGTNDPRKTAANYVSWCKKNKYTPKFSKWATNANYYKLLADFRLFKDDGSYAPQTAVRQVVPDAAWQKSAMEALLHDNANAVKLDRETEPIVDEISREVFGLSAARAAKNKAPRASFSVDMSDTPNLLATYIGTKMARSTYSDPTKAVSDGEIAGLVKRFMPKLSPEERDLLAAKIKTESAERAKMVREEIGTAGNDASFLKGMTKAETARYKSLRQASGRKGAVAQEQGQNAKESLEERRAKLIADAVAAESGLDAKSVEIALGIDLVQTITNLYQEMEDRPRKSAEEDASDDVSTEEAPEVDEAVEAKIRAIVENLRYKSYWKMKENDDAKRSRDLIDEAMRLAEEGDSAGAKRMLEESAALGNARAKKFLKDFPKFLDEIAKAGAAVNAEARAESRANEDEGKKDEAEGPSMEALLAEAILEEKSVDLANPEQLAIFLEYLARENWNRRHNIQEAIVPWNDPVAFKFLKSTASNIYSRMARGMMYQARRESAMSIINRMRSAPDAEALGNLMRYAGRVIHDGMIRDRQRKLVKDIDRMLMRDFGATGVFSQKKEEIKRKVSADLELRARAIRKAIWRSDAWVAKRIEELQAFLTGERATFEGAGRDVEQSKLYQQAMRELAALNEFGALVHRTPGEIDDARVRLEELKNGDDNAAKIAQREARTETAARLLALAFDAGKTLRKDKNWLSRHLDAHLDFKNLLLDMTRYCKDEQTRKVAEDIVNYLQSEIQRANDKSMEGKRKHFLDFKKAVEDIYGQSFGKVISDLLAHDERFDEFGTINDLGHKIEMSRGQAIQLYVSMLQRQYSKGALDVDENGNYTNSSPRAKRYQARQHEKIRALLSNEDLALVAWLGNWYDKNRVSLSNVSEQVVGTPVQAENENYFPAVIRQPKQGMEKPTVSLWSPFPGSLSSRVAHNRDFDVEADIVSTWMNRMTEGEQWKNHAKLGIELRGIFGRNHLQETIATNHGDNAVRLVNEFITDILRGGAVDKVAADARNAVDKIRGYTALFALGYNAGVMLKQTTSMPAFAFEIGYLNCAKYMATALTPEGLAAMRIVFNSEQRKNRWDSGNSDLVAAALADKNPNAFKRFLQKGMFFNKIGDIIPTLIVGQGIYRDAVRQGLTQEDALTRVWEIVNRTQQTGQQDNLSEFQRRSRWSGLLYQFLSTQRQYLAYQITATRAVLAQPGSGKAWKRFAGVTLLNNLILPSLYYGGGMLWNAILGKKPDDDWMNSWVASMIMGPYAALFCFGFVGKTALDAFINGKHHADYNTMMPTEQMIKRNAAALGDTLRILCDSAFNDEEMDFDGILKNADEFLRGTNAAYRDIMKLRENSNK